MVTVTVIMLAIYMLHSAGFSTIDEDPAGIPVVDKSDGIHV